MSLHEGRSSAGKKLFAVLALASLGALLYFLVPASSFREQGEQPIEAPNFTLTDISGRQVSLSQYRGHVVFIDFWATWCGPCQEEIPDLITLYNRFKGQGFVILGIAMDSLGARAVVPFVKQAHIPYPILLSNGGEPPAGYPVPGFPTGFLIDAKGRMLARYLGPQSADDLSQDVEAALKD
ncbi:MAG TPA: TlpA disulfide reductase family protein [Elusimicrobiota bacterium]|nr:TlpA disulfide reductase family protein [Elusimicrobiota bacterium]